MNAYRPTPGRFFGGIGYAIAGIGCGVTVFVAVGVLFGLHAIADHTYTSNMSPEIRLLFIPAIVIIVALLALPVDIALGLLARPRVLPTARHALLLGAAYSLFALPLAMPPQSVALDHLGTLDDASRLVGWLLPPILAAALVRFRLGRLPAAAAD